MDGVVGVQRSGTGTGTGTHEMIGAAERVSTRVVGVVARTQD
jgi:hypothetical protein